MWRCCTSCMAPARGLLPCWLPCAGAGARAAHLPARCLPPARKRWCWMPWPWAPRRWLWRAPCRLHPSGSRQWQRACRWAATPAAPPAAARPQTLLPLHPQPLQTLPALQPALSCMRHAPGQPAPFSAHCAGSGAWTLCGTLPQRPGMCCMRPWLAACCQRAQRRRQWAWAAQGRERGPTRCAPWAPPLPWQQLLRSFSRGRGRGRGAQRGGGSGGGRCS